MSRKLPQSCGSAAKSHSLRTTLGVTLFGSRETLFSRGGPSMRMRKMWMWTAALALAAYGLPASGGTLYKWTAEDGSVSFADDAKRIPPAYRAKAQKIQTSGITGYKRFSPTKAEGQ